MADRETGDRIWPVHRHRLHDLYHHLLLGSMLPGLAAGLFVVFNFTGGYLQSSIILSVILTLVAAFRVTPRLSVATTRQSEGFVGRATEPA